MTAPPGVPGAASLPEAANKYAECTEYAVGDGTSPDPDSDARPAPVRLDALVDQFVAEIEHRFPRRLRTRRRTLKRRLLHLIRVKLPPLPRRPGRPRRPHVTRALDLYRQQKREVQQGTRPEINWTPIAVECLPVFAKIRSDLKRRFELTRLRNAVYARERRKHRSAHKRRTRSSDGNNPPAC